MADVALGAQLTEPEPAGQQASGAGAMADNDRGDGTREASAMRPVVSAADYAGTYVSDELGTSFTVSLKGGEIHGAARG